MNRKRIMQSRTSNSTRRLIGPLIAMSLLTGCATVGSERRPCIPVVNYSMEFLAQTARELEALRTDSPIVRMLTDYSVMREQARACQ